MACFIVLYESKRERERESFRLGKYLLSARTCLSVWAVGGVGEWGEGEPAVLVTLLTHTDKLPYKEKSREGRGESGARRIQLPMCH